MADGPSCPIDKGAARHKILSGKCPNCNIGLFAAFGPKMPADWWRYSCHNCGYNFSNIPGAPKP